MTCSYCYRSVEPIPGRHINLYTLQKHEPHFSEFYFCKAECLMEWARGDIIE